MSRQSDREEKLRAAMASLLPNPNFQEFIDVLRELKDGAVSYAVQHTAVKDQRESLAALGEVRAYLDIIGIVDAHHQAIEHGLEQEHVADMQGN